MFKNRMEITRTPWGKAQTQKDLGEGISFVTTERHGGYKLDRQRNAKVPAYMRKKGGWYEEDCEWSSVALTFPQLFSKEVVDVAKRTLERYFPTAYEKWEKGR